ncbi:MAG: hypothetical protein QM831_11900 [Kofleriaceae bacterium]
MPIAITSWLRAYFALREQALETRGYTETITENETIIQTPRTVGNDVIAIAAVIDPYVRSIPIEEFGTLSCLRRWAEAVDDIWKIALVEPNREYAENDSFWHELAHISVYLHSQGTPLAPASEWNALLRELSTEHRNAGPKSDGPFKHFDVKSFDELYLAQFNYLREQRGADDKEPEAGMRGFKKPIPRATNADVVALADYWSSQFANAKKVFGYADVAQRWKLVLADVDALARKGPPTDVYPKNNGFWRELGEVAIRDLGRGRSADQRRHPSRFGQEQHHKPSAERGLWREERRRRARGHRRRCSARHRQHRELGRQGPVLGLWHAASRRRGARGALPRHAPESPRGEGELR